MNDLEIGNLHELARRLKSTPRRVLVAAARMTDQSAMDVADCLCRIRTVGIRDDIQIENCARLMLTPLDSYSRDALGSALLALWQGPGQAD